jgi:phage gpG-like protein
MKNFRSLSDFANHLTKLAAAAPAVTHHMTEQGAAEIEKIAKAEIGHYQPAVGPFAKWDPLTDETEKEKSRLGYKLNAPLERTGEMRRSISRTVSGNEAVVGSTDEKMLWHELGQGNNPPRAVLGPAAIRGAENMKARFALGVAAWLAGRNWRARGLK